MTTPFDFGPLPKVHPRHDIVEKARLELDSFLLEFANRHGLTRAEYLGLLSDAIRGNLQQAIAAERRKDGSE